MATLLNIPGIDAAKSIITPKFESLANSSPLGHIPSFPAFPKNGADLVSAVTPSSLKSILPSAQSLGLSTDVLGIGGQSKTKDSSSDFKVKLVSVLDTIQGGPGFQTRVVFDVTPIISESRTVEYTPVQPIHMPGGIQVFKTTGSRTFELTAHFISRNSQDATTNSQNLQTLRSWTMPFFGRSSTNLSPAAPTQNTISGTASKLSDVAATQLSIDAIKSGSKGDGVNLLGAPPEVLYLYGYSQQSSKASNADATFNLKRIPVVLTSLTITYPDDVDYIPTLSSKSTKAEPFPVKMDVNITLAETHSPMEYEQFKLQAYKAGTLRNF